MYKKFLVPAFIVILIAVIVIIAFTAQQRDIPEKGVSEAKVSNEKTYFSKEQPPQVDPGIVPVTKKLSDTASLWYFTGVIDQDASNDTCILHSEKDGQIFALWNRNFQASQQTELISTYYKNEFIDREQAATAMLENCWR